MKQYNSVLFVCFVKISSNKRHSEERERCYGHPVTHLLDLVLTFCYSVVICVSDREHVTFYVFLSNYENIIVPHPSPVFWNISLMTAVGKVAQFSANKQ